VNVRVAEISVNKLFGSLDHVIPMRLGERVTLIHGPNGIGKTTILRAVANIFASNYSVLRRMPFGSIGLRFEDGRRLRVKRTTPNKPGVFSPGEDRLDLVFSLTEPGHKELSFILHPLDWDQRRYFPLGIIESRLEFLDRVGELEWQDVRTGSILGLEQVLEAHGEKLPLPRELLLNRTPGWLDDFLEELPLLFIETQRLISTTMHRKRPTRALASTVDQLSADLVEVIQSNLARSAAGSQELDRTFPSRLLKGSLPKGATEAAIRGRYEVQGTLRGRLMSAGLLDSAEELALPKRRLADTERRVLWQYLKDVDRKLREYDWLLERIELFKEIINSKFKYKQLAISNSSGFMLKTADDNILPPSDLSSGEQHEIVLAYQLLFRVQPGSLILIDEPELSLHVSWQHKFLADLRRISTVSDLDFLVATHSPQIVHGQWDLAVDLEFPRT
jgi:energy-coupling factor transporter ATP-binding protein EcfA2